MEAVFQSMKHPGVSTIASQLQTPPTADKSFDNSVENGAIIITFQAELDKISAGLRSFFGPQLNVNFPTGCN